MIVIADTSPVNYLIRIGHIDVLPILFSGILVPPSVMTELRNPLAPEAVRQWIMQPAAWLKIQAPRQTPDPALLEARLGAGERDAILLAQELGANELIIDELRGRRVAQLRRLHFIGTLGVLRTAADQGLLDFKEAIARLQTTNFYIAPKLLDLIIGDEEG